MNINGLDTYTNLVSEYFQTKRSSDDRRYKTAQSSSGEAHLGAADWVPDIWVPFRVMKKKP